MNNYEKLQKIAEILAEKAIETSKKKEKIPLSVVTGGIKAAFPDLNMSCLDKYSESFLCEKDESNFKVFDTLVQHSFLYKCGDECRRSLSNFAANVSGSIDYLMFIIICALPLTQKTPPEFQALLNLYLRVTYNFCASMNVSALFKLDYSMVRMITDEGEELTDYNEDYSVYPNYLELGPNPIVYIARKATITHQKANTKKPIIEPETEELWKYFDNPPTPTFSEYLAGADLQYRMIEQKQREADYQRFFDENIANCLFQAYFTPDGQVELENAELLQDSITEALKLDNKYNVGYALSRFMRMLLPTFYWVQYIRAYLSGDPENSKKWARQIIDHHDCQYCETFCLFDSIHYIFSPKRTNLECTLRED